MKKILITLIIYVTVETITGGGNIDERGFYHDVEENLRYARVHTYRGLLFTAQERLWLCKKLIESTLIDWEILRDEGILINEFDKLTEKMDERVTKEINSVDVVMQVNPRTAKIILPVNQSSVDEISNHFKGLIRCLEEQKPEKYARDRFEEMIYQLSTMNGELIDTFNNVTTSIMDIKQKYNV